VVYLGKDGHLEGLFQVIIHLLPRMIWELQSFCFEFFSGFFSDSIHFRLLNASYVLSWRRHLGLCIFVNLLIWLLPKPKFFSHLGGIPQLTQLPTWDDHLLEGHPRLMHFPAWDNLFPHSTSLPETIYFLTSDYLLNEFPTLRKNPQQKHKYSSRNVSKGQAMNCYNWNAIIEIRYNI
jgi:hypothetical protein